MVYAILQLVGSQREHVSAWQTQRLEGYLGELEEANQLFQAEATVFFNFFYFAPHFLKANLRQGIILWDPVLAKTSTCLL